MYVRMVECKYVCIHACMYISMYICTPARMYVNVYAYVRMCGRMRVCMHLVGWPKQYFFEINHVYRLNKMRWLRRQSG